MNALCSPANERSRKAYSAVLQSLQDPGTQRSVALALGVSESTVSRIKTEKLEDAVTLLYQLGFKVVSQAKTCVDSQVYQAVCTLAGAAMSCPDTARKLTWDEE